MVANYSNDDMIALLDGVNLSTLNCALVRTHGFMSHPRRKETVTHNWNDDHGLEVDLGAVYFGPRLPSMEILVWGDTLQGMKTNAEAIVNKLTATGLRHVKLPGLTGVYLLFVSEEISIERVNRGISNKQFGKIFVRFTEPHPVTRQWKTTQATPSVSLAMTITDPVWIHWGNGDILKVEANGTYSKSYAAGVYCAVVFPTKNILTVTPTNLTEL